jgi:hypothetical protein
VTSNKYRTEMLPNARLAGLLRKEKGSDSQALAPLLFAEVQLPNAKAGQVPRLHSKLPDDRFVFCWDGRRSCGYLLVTPGSQAERDLRFRVRWQPVDAVMAATEVQGEP